MVANGDESDIIKWLDKLPYPADKKKVVYEQIKKGGRRCGRFLGPRGGGPCIRTGPR